MYRISCGKELNVTSHDNKPVDIPMRSLNIVRAVKMAKAVDKGNEQLLKSI